MNCDEAHVQLSEYLDQTLDHERMNLVERHLHACLHCRVDYDELRDAVRQLKSLPVVDPPLGFAQRVMAHAAEIELRPSFWQRVLTPWQGRAPIQAVAVMVVVVLAVFLYQNDQRLQRHDIAPLDANVSLPAPTTAIVEPQALHDSPLVKSNVASAPTTSRDVRPSDNGTTRRVAEANQPKDVADQFNRGMIAGDAPATTKRAPIPVQEVTTGRTGPRLGDNAIGFGGSPFSAPRQSMSPFVPNTAGLTTNSVNEPTPDVEFVVRRRSVTQRPEQRDGGADVARRRAETEPSSTSLESAQRDHPSAALPAAPSAVEIRWFSVAPEHLDQFRKELGAEAIIESEGAVIKRDKEVVARFDKTFAVKVVILPPAER